MTSPLVRRRTEERACERIRPASGAGGRWFESSHPDQYLQGAASPGSLFFFVFRTMSDPDGLPKLKIDCPEDDIFCAPILEFGSGSIRGGGGVQVEVGVY